MIYADSIFRGFPEPMVMDIDVPELRSQGKELVIDQTDCLLVIIPQLNPWIFELKA
jgi:hypothetical protein